MFKIILVGISGVGLAKPVRELLGRCGAIVVSSRYAAEVEGLAATIIPIAPVQEAIAAIKDNLCSGDVGVVASGDPLFFGIGRTLLAEFGPECVQVFPALSALQLACARFKIPWDDMQVITLHGRENDGATARILNEGKVAVFTDHYKPPNLVAAELLRYLQLVEASDILTESRIYVAENLGAANERLLTGTIAEIVGQSFAPLNIMLMVRPKTGQLAEADFGLPEEEISHSRGLITKDEVRAVTLHKLRLPARGVLWDVGAGSGSVTVEAARMRSELNVFAIEKEPQQLANIKKNIVACETFNVVPVAGSAPAALAGLPAPDRVFIGGSAGNLESIVSCAARQLRKGGRIVVNAVTEKTGREAPELLAKEGFRVKMSQVRVCRFGHDDNKTKRVDFNPITVVTGY